MAVIQRVANATVKVDGEAVGAIGRGLLVFLGVKKGDTARNSQELADKIVNLRIFSDEAGKMNRSVKDESGEILVVSQFTLYGNTEKGNRPSFSAAAPAAEARMLYQGFVERCTATGLKIATGLFQAHMEVELTNDGPVTLLCLSENQ